MQSIIINSSFKDSAQTHLYIGRASLQASQAFPFSSFSVKLAMCAAECDSHTLISDIFLFFILSRDEANASAIRVKQTEACSNT